MTSSAPDRIWVREIPHPKTETLIGLSYHRKPMYLNFDAETEYVRIDLVDDLLMALNNLIETTARICEASYGDAVDEAYAQARLAIQRLEDTDD